MWCSGFGTSPVPRAAVLTPGSRCTTVRRLEGVCLRGTRPRLRSVPATCKPTRSWDAPPPRARLRVCKPRRRPCFPSRPAYSCAAARARCKVGAGPAAGSEAEAEWEGEDEAAAPSCGQRLGRKLLRAACRGQLRELRRLVGAGADVNFTSCGKATPLFCAARKGHADIVCFLLNRGVDVNARTCHGSSPLHAAAYHDYRGRVMDFLVAGGADVDATDRAGRTPLHLAAEAGNAQMVRKLLAAGASRKVRDAGGFIPYDLTTSPYMRHLLRPPVMKAHKCKVDSIRGNLELMVKAQCIKGVIAQYIK